MSDETIKSFLVSLGFKVDQSGLKKFSDGVLAASAAVEGLALAAGAAAIAAAAATAKIAASFEDLYYTSLRVKSSVENIKGFGYAVSQLGGSTDGFRSSLENLAAFMRNNPAAESLLKGMFGVQTRNKNGSLRDSAVILRDVARSVSKLAPYLQQGRLDLIGMDYKTYQALLRDNGAFEDQMHQMAVRMGIDFADTSVKAKDFMQDLRSIGMAAQIVATAMAAFIVDLERFPGMRKDADDLVKSFDALVKALNISPNITFLNVIGNGLKGILEEITETIEAITALRHGDLAGAASHARAALVKSPAGKLIAAVHNSIPPNPGVGGSGGPLDSARAGWNAAPAWLGGRNILQAAILGAKMTQQAFGIPAAISLAQWALESGSGSHMPAGSNNPFGIKATGNQPYVEAWTNEEINGQMVRVKAKFRKFASISDAFMAHGELLAHSKRFAEARKHTNNARDYANALTGVYATDHLYGKKLNSIIDSQAPLLDGAAHLTVAPNTQIHVHGSGDPVATAHAVKVAQMDVNGALLRNSLTKLH